MKWTVSYLQDLLQSDDNAAAAPVAVWTETLAMAAVARFSFQLVLVGPHEEW